MKLNEIIQGDVLEVPKPLRDERLANPIKYNKHLKRKNNNLVAAMYAMYCSPKSLAEVAEVYKRTRQAVYDLFRTRGYKLRLKPMRGLVVAHGIRWTEMKGGYLRGTTPRGRMTLHKYVWEKFKGKIPPGFVIAHKDGDPKNNVLKNLKLVPKCSMPQIFNPEMKRNDKKSWETRRARKEAEMQRRKDLYKRYPVV